MFYIIVLTIVFLSRLTTIDNYHINRLVYNIPFLLWFWVYFKKVMSGRLVSSKTKSLWI